MSHSQFHSTKLLILRHAWLNLRDKHMTTGRINQVTITARTPFSLFKRKKNTFLFPSTFSTVRAKASGSR